MLNITISLILLFFSFSVKKTGIIPSKKEYFAEKYSKIKKLHMQQTAFPFLEDPKSLAGFGYQALLNSAAERQALHQNEAMILAALEDKKVNTELFAAMVLTYFQPQELVDKLLRNYNNNFISYAKKVIELEKKNGVTFMILLLKTSLIKIYVLKDKKEAINLSKKFKIEVKEQVYTKRGRIVLEDLQLEALFSGDNAAMEKIRPYYRLSDYWNIDRNSPDLKYRILRHYMAKASVPAWLYKYKDVLLKMLRELVVAARDYRENYNSLILLEYITGITKNKLTRELLAEENMLIEKEYDRCVSNMLYFAALRGYESIMQACSLFEAPGKIYLKSEKDKKELIKMCMDASPLRHKNQAMIELEKLIEIGRP